MAKNDPTIKERVAVVETELRSLTGSVKELRDTVTIEFEKFGKRLDENQLNGETPKVKNIARRVGDPADVEILAEVVAERKRRNKFLGFAGTSFGNAFFYVLAGIVLAAAHSAIHAHFPAIP